MVNSSPSLKRKRVRAKALLADKFCSGKDGFGAYNSKTGGVYIKALKAK